MAVILFSGLALAYIFSGWICCLAFLKQFNQFSKLSGQQRLLAILFSCLIVVLWPMWIMLEISSSQKQSEDRR